MLGLTAETAFRERGRMLRHVSGARFDKYVSKPLQHGERSMTETGMSSSARMTIPEEDGHG
jgi:hypothetical protein